MIDLHIGAHPIGPSIAPASKYRAPSRVAHKFDPNWPMIFTILGLGGAFAYGVVDVGRDVIGITRDVWRLATETAASRRADLTARRAALETEMAIIDADLAALDEADAALALATVV